MGELPNPESIALLFDLFGCSNDNPDHLHGDLGCFPSVFRDLKGFHVLIKDPVPIAQHTERDV